MVLGGTLPCRGACAVRFRDVRRAPPAAASSLADFPPLPVAAGFIVWSWSVAGSSAEIVHDSHRRVLRTLHPPRRAGAAGAENQPSIPCKIKGFKTFCKYWDSCTKAPANSVTSNGRCLYSRMGTLNPDASLRDQNMSGSYSKVTFVSGPDTVAKLAEWHCTPGSCMPQPCPCALGLTLALSRTRTRALILTRTRTLA